MKKHEFVENNSCIKNGFADYYILRAFWLGSKFVFLKAIPCLVIVLLFFLTAEASYALDSSEMVWGHAPAATEGDMPRKKFIVEFVAAKYRRHIDYSNKYKAIRPDMSDKSEQDKYGNDVKRADGALNRYLIESSQAILSMLKEDEFIINYRYSTVPMVAVSLSKSGFDRLSRDKRIVRIYPDKVVSLDPVVKDLFPQTKSTSRISLLGVKEAWRYGVTGKGMYIAVLDTGINRSHKMFANKTIVENCFYDCERGEGVGDGRAIDNDADGHGTHVAGIAAGNYIDDDIFGVAKDSDLIICKVFDRNGNGYTSLTIAALEYVYSLRAARSIAAVNCSLGGNGDGSFPCASELSGVINNLYNVNIPVVAASGNDGNCAGISDPACSMNVVPVASVDSNEEVSSYSNFLSKASMLFAPGRSVTSASNKNIDSYHELTGTSMAAPHIAGAIALIRQDYYSASPSYPRNKLESTRNHHVYFSSGCAMTIDSGNIQAKNTLFNHRPGEVSVTIEPPAAVYSGAAWRINDSFWNKSEDTVSDLPVGGHTVDFSGLDKWNSPVPQSVKVLSHTRHRLLGTYLPVMSGARTDFDVQFSKGRSFWASSCMEGIDVESGGVRATFTNPTGQYCSLTYVKETYSNFDYSVKMARFGPKSVANAIVFRADPLPYQSSGEVWSGYYFVYSNNGYYSIRYVYPGGVKILADGNSKLIKPFEFNTLRVKAVGSFLEFYINGSLVRSLQSNSSMSGYVGVTAYGSNNSGGSLLLERASLKIIP